MHLDDSYDFMNRSPFCQAAPPSSDDDLDEEDRLAMEAFETEGFDGNLVESETKRQKENEADAEEKLATERALELEKKKKADVAAAIQKARREEELAKVARDEQARANSPQRRKVFVSGLAGAATEATLEDLFKDHGTIVDIHIPKIKADIGFVEYATSSEAATAVRRGPY